MISLRDASFFTKSIIVGIFRYSRKALTNDLTLKYLTLAAAIASAIIYYKQLSALSSQLGVMREQEDTQLRAYFGPTDNMFSGVQSDGGLYISISVKNFGPTPAYDVDLETISDFQRPIDGYKVNIVDPAFPDQNEYKTVYPSETVQYKFKIPFSPDQMGDVKSGRRVLAIQGKVYYRTIFGNEVWSTMCFLYNDNNVKKSEKVDGSEDEVNSGNNCSTGFNGS